MNPLASTAAISKIIAVLKASMGPRFNLTDLEGRAAAESLMGFRRPRYLASGVKNPPHSPLGDREDLTLAFLERLSKRPSRSDLLIQELSIPNKRELRNLASKIQGELFDSPSGYYYERMGNRAIQNLLRDAKRGKEVQDRGVPALIDLLTNPNVR